MVTLKKSIKLSNNVTITVTGGEYVEEDIAIILLDKAAVTALSSLCRFPVHRAYLIMSDDNSGCTLYVERLGAEYMPIWGNEEDFYKYFPFLDQAEACELYAQIVGQEV